MWSYIGTPKNINFPFGTNGKLMVLGVPILQHFRVFSFVEVIFVIYHIVMYTSQIKKHPTLNIFLNIFFYYFEYFYQANSTKTTYNQS